MIKVESVLRIGDNSGAKLARCIKIIGVGNKKTATCGDVIFITLRKFISSKKVKKRTIYLGLIIGVRYWLVRKDGSCLKFFANRVLVFNKQYKFLGTRVYGGIAKEIKIQSMKEKKDRKSFQKVVSYSSLIV